MVRVYFPGEQSVFTPATFPRPACITPTDRDGNNELYIIHPDGMGLTRLTNSPISDWQPRWRR